MVKKVTAMKARQSFGQVLEEVYYKGDQFVIERAGRPMAAVVPVWFVNEYQESRKRLFGTIDRIQKRNKGVRPETVERDAAEAVRAVRGAARKTMRLGNDRRQ